MTEKPLKIEIFGPDGNGWGEKEIADRRRKDKLVEAVYDEAVGEMAALVPEHLDEAGKLAVLYSLFIDMEYDHAYGENVSDDGLVTVPESSRERYRQSIEGEDFWLDGKEGVMLGGAGVCRGFSEAFKDVADKVGIECAVAIGKTATVTSLQGNPVEAGHAWIQVAIHGKVYNIDPTYGIYAKDEGLKRKKGLASELTPSSFFLIDSDTLRQIGPHHDFEDSADLLRAAAE